MDTLTALRECRLRGFNAAPAILSSYYTDAVANNEQIRDNKENFCSPLSRGPLHIKKVFSWLRQGIVNTSAHNIRLLNLTLQAAWHFWLNGIKK
jgi:uncharacterized protein YegL